MSLPRRAVLAGLLAAAAGRALAEAPANTVRPQPRPPKAGSPAPNQSEALIVAAKLGGEVCFALSRPGEAALLEGRQPDRPMPPASVAKAVTALFALDRLGPDHRFETRVMRLGTVSGGTLHGDLLLVGGGDPGFDSDQLGDLVAQLAATGLRRVTGGFIVVDGALPRVERLVRDQPEHVGYNPALSGLILNFNRVHFEWAREGDGWVTRLDARGERFRPEVGTSTMRIADRDLPVFAYQRAEGRDRWSVASTALAKPGSRWLPVRDPGAYAGAAFAALAAGVGITLPPATRLQDLPRGALSIVSHQSPPLHEVLRLMLKHSTNLTAEVVGLTASGAPGLGASAQAMNLWARSTLGAAPDLQDHSGLNSASRVSARDMVAMLQGARALRHGAMLPALLRENGLADETGKEVPDAAVRIFSKSGTMNYVSGLAGHLRGEGDRGLIFAVFSADLPRRESVPVEQREGPPGSSSWAKRARRLQGQLIRGWALEHL